MGIVVVLLIWYFAVGRNNPKTFKKLKKNKGLLIFAAIALTTSGVLPAMLGVSIALGFTALPVYVVYKILKGIFMPDEKEVKKTVQQKRNSSIPKTEQLPNAVPKRIKIVEKFNQKYDLTLTDAQIQTIVDASYITADWEIFIHSMTKEYATIHQWYKAPVGGWLRAYIKIFNVQQISSDMQQQKNICLDSLNQIFSAIDLSTYNTPAWNINKINNQFMTNFDDISFMIAYRFLEANGYKHNLGKVEILQTDKELSQLKNKYDHMNMPGI